MIGEEIDELDGDEYWEAVDRKIDENMKTKEFAEVKNKFYSMKKEADHLKNTIIDYCKKYNSAEKELMNSILNDAGNSDCRLGDYIEEYMNYAKIERSSDSQDFILYSTQKDGKFTIRSFEE